jgi:hypothetical protein
MKRIALAVTCVVFVPVAGVGAGCGGGTLGTPGAGNSTGSVTTGPARDGIGGASFPVGAAGSGGAAGSPGIGGDGAPAPGVGGYGNSPTVGAGGYGGVVGPGGGSGATGRGGTGFVSCVPPPPPVCGVLCGNGLLDTCRVAVAPQCSPITLTEQCDGQQFGGDSCLQRGYGSGDLSCRSDCTIDDSGCSDCLSPGGSLVSCARAPIAFPYVSSFSLAATDHEVGLAQIDNNLDTGSARLTFARLDAGLAVINAVGLDDTIQPGPLQGLMIDSAVAAPLPSGWVVAGCGYGQLFLHTLDANGKKVARTTLSDDTGYQACASGTLALAASGGGPTLLTYESFGGGLQYVLLGGDGLPLGSPAVLADSSTLYIGIPRAAWTGDAFTIALPVESFTGGVYADLVRLLRVTPDGALTTIADILKGEFYQSPVVVSGASDIRLVYTGSEPGFPFEGFAVVLRRIGTMGQLLSGAVTLTNAPSYYAGNTRAVAFGDDTVTLLTGAYQEEVTLARVDGTSSLSLIDVARGPVNDLYMYDMVARGPDVVVGWIHGQGVLTLARVTP